MQSPVKSVGRASDFCLIPMGSSRSMFRTNWKCSFGIKQNIWNKVAWKFNIFKLYKVVNKSNVAFKSSFDFLLKKDPVLPREKKAFRVEPG